MIIEQASVTLNPNPASTELTIGFSARPHIPVTVEVYDLLSRLILSKTYPIGNQEYYSPTLDINSVNNGYYILRVKQGSTVLASKRFEILR